MKNKKLLIIIASLVVLGVFCICASIVTFIFYTQYQNAQKLAKQEVTNELNKTQSDLKELKVLAVDQQKDVNSNTLTKSQQSEWHKNLMAKLAQVENDIPANNDLINKLPQAQSDEIKSYYIKLKAIITAAKLENQDYDKYSSMFDPENSRYSKASAMLAKLYEHKIGDISDVQDIVRTYDFIIKENEAVHTEFMNVSDNPPETRYRKYVVDYFAIYFEYFQNSKAIFQKYIDTNSVPSGSFYDILKPASDSYSAKIKTNIDGYEADVKTQIQNLENEYKEVMDQGDIIQKKLQ